LYNAIAGSCAEQEANAGGGGSPPAGITLNQIYFSDSATGGASAGNTIEFWQNNMFLQIGTQPINRSYGSAQSIAQLLSTPTVSALSATETKSAYTLPASTLISFMNLAVTGQTSPYTNNNEPSQILLNIGMFLQAPNGLNSITQYELDNMTIGWGGVISQFPFIANNTPNFPQQNSLGLSTDYPSNTNVNFNPATGNSGDWGILGNSGVLTLNFSANYAIDLVYIFDIRARGASPSAGQTATFRYKAIAVNGAGATETAYHTVEITLT